MKVRAEHYALVDDRRVRSQFEWVRKTRKDLWPEVKAAIDASWDRTDTQKAAAKRRAMPLLL